MGYTKFTSVDFIVNYNYRTKGEINEAISSLQTMYNNGNIKKYQYDNVLSLLEDKLEDM